MSPRSVHDHDVVTFPLVSPGDYRDCTIAVWSTFTFDLLTTTKTSDPVHDLKWDPSTANEFASVGDNGTLLFWLLDETQVNIALNVHQADVPDDLLQKHHMVCIDGGDWLVQIFMIVHTFSMTCLHCPSSHIRALHCSY